MSTLKKARIHTIDPGTSVIENLDIYTSSDAVFMENGRTLEEVYSNNIGDAHALNTENKVIVDAINEVKEDLGNLESDEIFYCGRTTGTNTYTVTNSKITDANFKSGLTVRVIINSTSTGACTLGINLYVAYPILDSLGNPIVSGGLKKDVPYQFCFNGSNFIVLGKGGGGTATPEHILAGDTATTNAGLITGTMVSNSAETQASKIVTLVNMLPNGTFDGTTGWSTPNNGGSSAPMSTAQKFGTYSLALTGSASYAETSIGYQLSYVQGHKYYVSVWVNSSIAGKSTDIYWPEISPYPHVTLTCSAANTWYQASFISSDSTIASGTYNLRYDNNNANGTGVMYFDGGAVIDLTAAYGAGYEPTKAQMDTIMSVFGGWFDGSAIIGKIPNGAYLNNGTTGGPDVLCSVPSLISSNIKANASILGVPGKASVVDTTDATAVAAQILSGITAYVKGSKVTGTLPTWGPSWSDHWEASTTSVGAYSYNNGANYLYFQIPKGGYNQNIDWVMHYEPYLFAQNIVKGATIGGVAGNAAKIVSGTVYSSGDASPYLTISNLPGQPTYAIIIGMNSSSSGYDRGVTYFYDPTGAYKTWFPNNMVRVNGYNTYELFSYEISDNNRYGKVTSLPSITYSNGVLTAQMNIGSNYYYSNQLFAYFIVYQ